MTTTTTTAFPIWFAYDDDDDNEGLSVRGSNRHRQYRIERDILIPVMEDRSVVSSGGMGEKYGMITATTTAPWISAVIEGRSGITSSSFKNSNRRRPRLDILKDIIKGFTPDIINRDDIVGGWHRGDEEGGRNNRQFIINRNDDIWLPGCTQEDNEEQCNYGIEEEEEGDSDNYDDLILDWGSLVAAPVIPSYGIRTTTSNLGSNNTLIEVISEDNNKDKEEYSHTTTDDWTIIHNNITTLHDDIIPSSPATTPSNIHDDNDFVVV